MSPANSLNRFVEAQATAYSAALAEVKRGRKQSHWMWYVFPQVQGLGLSATAQHYAIQDRAEAAAYLQHPVLGARLREISAALLPLETSDANRVFGSPDDLKLKSSMTLFAAVGGGPVFQAVLDKFFGGASDSRTLELLGRHA